MLTEEMQASIHNYTGGSVASVNEDGIAAVSPTATFVIVDDTTIVYRNFAQPEPVAIFRLDPRLKGCLSMP